jgi:hypothetical protein
MSQFLDQSNNTSSLKMFRTRLSTLKDPNLTLCNLRKGNVSELSHFLQLKHNESEKRKTFLTGLTSRSWLDQASRVFATVSPMGSTQSELPANHLQRMNEYLSPQKYGSWTDSVLYPLISECQRTVNKLTVLKSTR